MNGAREPKEVKEAKEARGVKEAKDSRGAKWVFLVRALDQ
jgi:hypothetical protein